MGFGSWLGPTGAVITPPVSASLFQFTKAFVKALAPASVVLLSCLVGARDAHATLGEDVASVAANEQHLSAVRHVVKLPMGGERHDLELPSGTVVHEYLSATGAVYAVTWRGPRKPNLLELLGQYQSQLASRDKGIGHNQMNVVGSDFRLQSMGHRRTSSGRAWVPSLVPAGVTIGSLD
jgi:hypothetical protein